MMIKRDNGSLIEYCSPREEDNRIFYRSTLALDKNAQDKLDIFGEWEIYDMDTNQIGGFEIAE